MLPKIGSKIRVITDWGDIQKSKRNTFFRYKSDEGIVTGYGEGELKDHFYLQPLKIDNPRVYNHIPLIGMNRVIRIENLDSNSSVDYEPIEKKKDRIWKIKSRTTDTHYHVRLSDSKLSCNCYAGLMNKKCWHKDHIHDLLEKEKGNG